jgi:uncharacterized protein with FMN-binding domain
MRRIVIWLASTVTVVVLLFGYHTSTNKTSSGTTEGGTSGSTMSADDEPSASASSPSSGSSGSRSTKITTYTGSVAQARWGPVQVKISVQGGRLTKVTILQHPSGNSRDAEINDHALPILINESLRAQSANIDMVSGATVTSRGYVKSLQAALDGVVSGQGAMGAGPGQDHGAGPQSHSAGPQRDGEPDDDD